jgi:hypothetical protein
MRGLKLLTKLGLIVEQPWSRGTLSAEAAAGLLVLAAERAA